MANGGASAKTISMAAVEMTPTANVIMRYTVLAGRDRLLIFDSSLRRCLQLRFLNEFRHDLSSSENV